MQFLTRTALAALALAVVAVSTPAAAIPIPCTGDKSFKVADKGIPRPDGRIVYLGYKYSYCVKGEWIGYIDDRNYIPLSNESSALMLAIAGGMKQLPEPPGQFSNPKAFWVEWLWASLLAIGLIASLRGTKDARTAPT